MRRRFDGLPTLGGLSFGVVRLNPNQLDALHVARAAFHRLDVLLTWNCTHIANPMQLPVIRGLCSAKGYRMPELVTQFEMMEAPE